MAAATPSVKQLDLIKGNQRFVFQYEVGEEAKMMDTLIEFVNNRDLPFDWFDAAVLAYQLGQHLAKELKTLPKKEG
jgi:hypothetical protein